ncbi:hypothetical protein CC2G_013998 [Coprinopsis cinerea AmutBmut pab1-1]|nr:hypothetical protein CC2G_013998 [Coprinopsis cinerea AmutBmut pab1-1]
MAYSEVDLQLHDCRNRDRRRSTVLEAFNHPLHPKTNPGRSFVIFSTPEYERMEEEHTFEKGLRKPEGCDEELIANGSGNPEDDTTKAWVVGRGLQTSEDLGALDNAVELLLGAKENRTDTEVHIERLRPRVDGIKGGRCYPMANSYEKQRECMAPCANVKIGKEEGEVHKIAHDLTRATTKMAMRSMDEAPERIQTCLRDHANRLGLPCVGTDTNYAFHAIQLNLAPAKSSDSGRLGEHMGPFGDEHYDNNDCPPHYTCMVVGSQLPDNYHPGRFFLLRDGFFTRLECGSSFVFNGRNFHVGDAPHP